MKSTLAERVKEALDGPPKKTQKALADACGVRAPSVNDWLSGKSKTIEGVNLLRAAQFLGVTPRWLAEGVGPMRDQTEAGTPADEFVMVRRADVKFSNGLGQVVYEEGDLPPLSFRTDFLRKLGISQGNAVVVDAEGASNFPKIIEGAVVLINRGDRERLNGDFFAFRHDGQLYIKRLERLDGIGILATAENSDFKPKQKVYGPRELKDFEVIGRAVWTGAML